MIRALFSELAAHLGGRRRFYRVSGDSMVPSLAHGDVVRVDTTVAWPRVGDLVVVRDPGCVDRILVKRVRSHGDESFAVGSDAPNGARDSRHFGSLGSEHLVGRVLGALRCG